MIDSKAILACAKKVFEVEIGGLEKTRDSLGDAFVATVRLMVDTLESDGIVVVTGVGKSLHVAEKMSAVFASTGTRSIVLNPVQAMHGDLGMTSPRDMLIALSFSGESEEIVKLVPAIRRHGLRVVAVTGNPSSTLATASDLVLPVPCGAEACPFGMAPTNSATATMAMGDALAMAMGDALAMAMVEARKFTVEEYAGNHPAGAIGRALTLKASDVMRKGCDFAKVPPTATVLQSLMAMTKAKAGSAVVADDAGMLVGIFTDGDFRRMVAERSAADVASTLSAEVSAVMTKSPMSIRDIAYAAEIVKVFERRRIDDLPVVDEAGRVVGLVDIQDLPKMKVI